VPAHLPFDGRAFRLRMGLRSLSPGTWLEPDGFRAADLALKQRLLAEHHDEVVALAPDPDGVARAAGAELADLVAGEVGGPGASVPSSVHPVEAAARLTQEDWCVHLPDGEGRWRLVAACVCFPTRWVLGDKIGRTVREIHAPVAFYDEQLADPVDAFFDRLAPGVDHGVWRLNWNLTDDAALFQPVAHAPAGRRVDITAANAGDLVWLRVERQTLVKLPGSGAVVFGIRVHEDPLRSLAGDPDALGRLGRSLRAMPEPTWEYKGLGAYGDAVLDWIAATGGPGPRGLDGPGR
jgi:dimethylamine monooxygenase subunit A